MTFHLEAMMHWCRREPAETENAALVVGIDKALDRVPFEQRAAFRRGDAQRTAELMGIDGPPLGELPVQHNRSPLLLGENGRK